MLRGIVLGLSLTLAAALQLVATPSASADGGLLGGLAEILTPGGDAADASEETDEPGLLGSILDTVDEVTEPLTGDLLDPVTGTLDSLTDDLDAPLTESLDETIAGLTEPLTETLTEAHPAAPAPAAAAPVASGDVGGAPAEAPLVGVATILDALLEPVAPRAADTITAVTEPLQPLVAEVAPMLLGKPESPVPGLLPLIPAGETLGPVVSALQPILDPALRLTSVVVRPTVMLVEPVATPVLRSIERILQPVAGLLQAFTSPVVDVPAAPIPAIEPAPSPGTGEPPPPRAASTAGLAPFSEGEAPTQVQALARAAVHTSVLMATAGLQALEVPGTRAPGTNPGVVAPTRFLEGVLLGAMDEPVRSDGASDSPPVLLPGSAGAGSKDSSSKFQAPFAVIPQYFVLLVAAYFLFLLAYGARSQSWLKCPVRPPI